MRTFNIRSKDRYRNEGYISFHSKTIRVTTKELIKMFEDYVAKGNCINCITNKMRQEVIAQAVSSREDGLADVSSVRINNQQATVVVYS